MKVLLIGDYSSFHVNLKKGLLELGVDCRLASNGDGWKKIGGSDFSLYENASRNFFISKYNHSIKPLLERKKFYGNDVVQFVHPRLFSNNWINMIMVKGIIENNKNSFVSVSGDAYSVYKSYVEGKLGNYYVYDDNPEAAKKYKSKKLHDIMGIKCENYLYNRVDGIIPIMFEYAEGVRNRKNCFKTIPVPFDANQIEYDSNKTGKKIVIMHGLYKEKAKGSAYILEAFNIINKKYPNEVEFIVDGKLPLDEYLKVLRRTNILVDQCKEHCWGMNACYGMAMGKVVLGGASPRSLEEFGIKTSPVIHIEPNVQMIVSKIENLIENKNIIERIGEESRRFVESFHDCKRIAQLYINTWSTK